MADAQDIERAFVEETNRLTAERLPVGALAFMLVFATSWIFEHRAHPERDVSFACMYGAEGIAVGAAVLLSRHSRSRPHIQMVAAITVVVLACCVGGYQILVQGEGEVLASALLYLVTGAMVMVPWGWQGQLPVALSAIVTYSVAMWLGVRTAVPQPINFLGLGAISALSVGGAAFLARHRLLLLRQAAELRAANAALAEANQTKNRFLAGVSHELRTPLNIIVGYTDLLLEGDFGRLPPDASDALRRVARSSHSVVYLINDLLDLSRVEAGHLTVHKGPVPLAEVFAEMSGFVEPRIDGKDVKFQVQMPGALAVLADRDRLGQILINLLSNAAKFTAHGEIHLYAHPPADAMIAIEVRDTGVGIAPTELPRIFEPFSQGSAGKKLGGVGIGLSLSARLAQAMGGQLSVNSEIDRGSTFVLRLPAAA
jgi:signal transduction histidine kinase